MTTNNTSTKSTSLVVEHQVRIRAKVDLADGRAAVRLHLTVHVRPSVRPDEVPMALTTTADEVLRALRPWFAKQPHRRLVDGRANQLELLGATPRAHRFEEGAPFGVVDVAVEALVMDPAPTAPLLPEAERTAEGEVHPTLVPVVEEPIMPAPDANAAAAAAWSRAWAFLILIATMLLAALAVNWAGAP